MSTTITVIIVNYNTGALLQQVVSQVLTDDSVSEIIIVDNNSQDESMSLLPENKKIQIYYRTENHGFAASCNFAANKTKAEYLLFLNPDCIPTQDSIKQLVQELQQQAKAAIIGCLVKNPDGSEQRATRRRLPTLMRAIKTYSRIEKLAKVCTCFAGVNLNFAPMPTKTQQVQAISGAFIIMRANIFHKIGGFDEKYPLHFEDLDLFKRTQDAGYKLLFNPNISVVHHQGTSSLSNPDVKNLKKQGLLRYFKKHESRTTYKIIRAFMRIL
ncbi:MAG TPA: glycosyltransferase family 2 protein [Oceanospirillales bacterium]|nr:glycosyltransferase family 2 protein [Oceanospirillales bacterium]